MNLQNPQPSGLRVTLKLETQPSGTIVASVIEFPDCRVEAAMREDAIAEVQAAFLERFAHIETIPWDVPLPSEQSESLYGSEHREERPWVKFAGMFQDDPDFAKIAADIWAEREVEDNTDVDPSIYALES